MAESLVQVTEGTGKKLHTNQRTIGANNVEDEVVILGEQYLASYIVHPNANISTATGASHLLQIMAGASLKVRIRRIEIFQVVLATTVSFIDFQLWRLSTAGTGGTAYNPAPLEPGDVAGATAMTLPTVKGTETTQICSVQPVLLQTLGASADLTQPRAVIDFDRPRSKPLIIAAGAANGIAIKNGGGVAGASIMVNVWLDESNF